MNEEIITWRINENLLSRILEIKNNERKPLKIEFAEWLRYIYNYKA